jgi:hypothetical protein
MQRGQILPFIGICLLVLMGFAGLAVDLGYVQYQERQQQSAADAAAIAAAQALISNNSCATNSSAAQTAAVNDASSNGFTNGSNSVTVTEANPPASGPFSSDNCAAQVNISAPHPAWFSRLFGFTGSVGTQATATVFPQGAGAGCLYLLNGGLSSAGNNINTPNCGILINGGVSTAGGTVDTDYFGYTGTLSEAGTSFTSAQPTQMLPVPNPCPDISGCNYLTSHPPAAPASPNSCGSFNVSAANQAIPAGCYSSITDAGFSGVTLGAGSNVGTISFANGSMTIGAGTDIGQISGAGATITFDPGLYVLTGGWSVAGGTYTGNGVTFYQENGGFSDAGANATFSACTTSCTGGAESGVLFFQPPSNSNSSSFAGSTTNYSGLVYAPTATVSAAGTGTGYTIWVMASGSVAGNGLTNTAPSPAPNAGPTPAGLFVETVVLAQ